MVSLVSYLPIWSPGLLCCSGLGVFGCHPTGGGFVSAIGLNSFFMPLPKKSWLFLFVLILNVSLRFMLPFWMLGVLWMATHRRTSPIYLLEVPQPLCGYRKFRASLVTIFCSVPTGAVPTAKGNFSQPLAICIGLPRGNRFIWCPWTARWLICAGGSATASCTRPSASSVLVTISFWTASRVIPWKPLSIYFFGVRLPRALSRGHSLCFFGLRPWHSLWNRVIFCLVFRTVNFPSFRGFSFIFETCWSLTSGWRETIIVIVRLLLGLLRSLRLRESRLSSFATNSGKTFHFIQTSPLFYKSVGGLRHYWPLSRRQFSNYNLSS